MRVVKGRHGHGHPGKGLGGVVVLKDSKALPDGTVVRVEPVEAAEPAEAAEPPEAGEERSGGPTIWEKLRKLAGTVEGLPSDLARNHDHYLYGRPKK